MAASIRARLILTRVLGNAVLRTNQLYFSTESHILYRGENATRKNLFLPQIARDISRRMIATSTIRWDDINKESESTGLHSQKQDEISEAELLQAVEYLSSEEYIERYGDKPVWANYKRNHKGRIPPMKTRRMCIRGRGEKRQVCGNPCPICRDSGLVLHYKNVKLLEQFICPHSWNIYSTFRTGLCRQQHKKLCATIEKARRHGLLPFSVPYTEYRYEDYYQDETQSKEKQRSVEL